MEGHTGRHPEETAIECVVRSLPTGNDHHQFLRRGEGWRIAAGWPMRGVPQGCGQGDRVRLRLELLNVNSKNIRSYFIQGRLKFMKGKVYERIFTQLCDFLVISYFR